MKPVIIVSATKAYALKVSKERRAGTFTRVSDKFVDAVVADVEAAIRLIAKSDNSIHAPVTPDEGCDWFITGEAAKKAEDRLNAAVRQLIQARVMRHPTMGCTLTD